MQQSVYNTAGEKVDTIDLPKSLFGQPMRPDLLHRVVESARYNAQAPTAHTKDRRERRGGGTKPWRQKGTGRARHGSIRSPLWRKGGVTFGPDKKKNLKRKVNQKEKQAGLATALSAKQDDNEVLLVDKVNFDEPNTGRARDILDALGAVEGYAGLPQRRENAALIIVPEQSKPRRLSFRNFSNITVKLAEDLHALDLLTYKYSVIVDPEAVFSQLEKRVTADKNKPQGT